MVRKKIKYNNEASDTEDRNEYNNEYEEENDGENINDNRDRDGEEDEEDNVNKNEKKNPVENKKVVKDFRNDIRIKDAYSILPVKNIVYSKSFTFLIKSFTLFLIVLLFILDGDFDNFFTLDRAGLLLSNGSSSFLGLGLGLGL